MGNQRKRSGLPPTPVGHPPQSPPQQPSMATDKASSSFERSSAEKDTQEIYGKELEHYHKTKFKNPDSLLITTFKNQDSLTTLRSSSSTVVSLRPRHTPPSMTTHHQNENEANWGTWVLCPHCNKIFRTEVCPPPARFIDMVSKYAPVEIDAAVIDDHLHISEDNLANLEFRLSDNRDRACLLERIGGILNLLVRTESFPDSTLITMLGFMINRVLSNDEVLERIAESDLRIVFLDAPRLRHFLLYLGVLAGDCNSVLFTENGGLLENNDFSEDESCLVLHERLLMPPAAIIQRPSVSAFYVDNAFVHTVRCFAESIKTQQYLDMLRNRDTILVSRDRGGFFLGLKSSMGQPLLSNGDIVSTNRSLMNPKDFADLLNFMCQRKGDTVLQTLLRPPAVPRSYSAPLMGNYKDPSYPNVGFSVDLENPQERVPPRRKKPFFYRYRNAFFIASTVLLQFASTILEYETEGKSRLEKLIMTGFSVLIGLYLMGLCVYDICELIRRSGPMTFARTYLSLVTIVEPLISTAHIVLGALDFVYTYHEKELGFPFRIGSLILLCSIVSGFMKFASSRAVLVRRDGRKWYKLENKIFCDGYISYELGEAEYEEEVEEAD